MDRHKFPTLSRGEHDDNNPYRKFSNLSTEIDVDMLIDPARRSDAGDLSDNAELSLSQDDSSSSDCSYCDGGGCDCCMTIGEEAIEACYDHANLYEEFKKTYEPNTPLYFHRQAVLATRWCDAYRDVPNNDSNGVPKPPEELYEIYVESLLEKCRTAAQCFEKLGGLARASELTVSMLPSGELYSYAKRWCDTYNTLPFGYESKVPKPSPEVYKYVNDY